MEPNDLRKTQDFRDMMLEFKGQTTQALKEISDSLKDIRAGEICPIGQRHEVEINNLKDVEKDQWTQINKLKRPVRQRVAVWGFGSAGIGGIIALVIDYLLTMRGAK